MKVSIVIPIYNSIKFVEQTVRILVRYMDSLCLEYEILLRDDGSTDQSNEKIKDLARGFQAVKCYENRVNRGLGFTLKRLFADAKGESIIYLDCDLPYGEKIIKVLLNELEANDIVVASRYMGKRNHVAVRRKLVSRFYYWFCRFLFKINVSDIGSGTVAFKQKVLKEISLAGEGFVIHIEIFMKALEKGFSIKEIAVDTVGWQKGSFRIFRHGIQTVIDTIKLKSNKL